MGLVSSYKQAAQMPSSSSSSMCAYSEAVTSVQRVRTPHLKAPRKDYSIGSLCEAWGRGLGAGLTHVLCTCRSISRISVNLSRRSMGSCSITAGREGGEEERVSQPASLVTAAMERRGRSLRLVPPPFFPPSLPSGLAPPPRSPPAQKTHSRGSPPGTAWRRRKRRPRSGGFVVSTTSDEGGLRWKVKKKKHRLVPSNMAPAPPTTPAARLSENNIGG